MNQIIKRISKNSTEDLVVELSEYKGYQLLSLRIWTKAVQGVKAALPTSKGFAVQVDQAEELREAIESACLKIKSEGLLNEEKEVE